jgi:hypothetical protein
MAIVKAFNCAFTTVKGEDRTMTFVQVGDLPAEFIAANTKGGVRPALKPGFETVWSVGEGWRTLNRNTARDYAETFATL